MAAKNAKIYADILSFLEESGKLSPERNVSYNDIFGAFVFLTDRIKPNTIDPHIRGMVSARLLVKKGETTYFVPENWKAILRAVGVTI